MFKRILFVGLAVVALLTLLVGLSVASGFTEDVQTARRVHGGYMTGAFDPYREGKYSVEELILGADLIAVVDLDSVSRGVVKQKRSNASGSYSQTGYVKSLEFHFQVDQYLKGQGPDRITGLVLHLGAFYRTAPGAMLGKAPDAERKTNWDDRKAVVFLRDDGKDPDVNWKTGRYWMAVTTTDRDFYSILNQYRNPWLPAVSEQDDEQTFLLEHDLNRETVTPETITLDDLKGRVSFLDQKVEGKSERYISCLYYQRQWHRETAAQGQPQYRLDEISIWSGLPAGTHVFTSQVAGHIAYARQNEPLQPGEEDLYLLAGQDAEFFTATTPGYISVARPLPAGEYRMFHSHLPYGMGGGCNGTIPDAEMHRMELSVQVEQPEWSAHEALFDPVEDGKAIAAGSSVGLLEPATFTNPDETTVTIERIAWEADGDSGKVTIRTSPSGGLADRILDFIGLDGQARISLMVADATAEDGDLSWTLTTQPWEAGDKLMLRLRSGE